MGKATSFFFGVLLGAVVGWVLGTLYAPFTGEETRDSLSTRAIELKGKAEQAADEIVQTVREQRVVPKARDLELRSGVEA